MVIQMIHTRDNLLKTAREIASALVGDIITKPLNLVRQNIINQHVIKTDLNEVPASLRMAKMRQVSETIKNYHESISQSSVLGYQKKNNMS